MTKSAEEIPDIKAKEFFENLFCMDFLTEEERQTIYDAAELYAKGRIRFEQSQPKEQPAGEWEVVDKPDVEYTGTLWCVRRKTGLEYPYWEIHFAETREEADRLKSLLNASEGDSVEFAEWASGNGWEFSARLNEWRFMDERKSTADLYTQFKNQKEGR